MTGRRHVVEQAGGIRAEFAFCKRNRSRKGFDQLQLPQDQEIVTQVFGVQRVAACDQCGGDDHRVTCGEPLSLGQAAAHLVHVQGQVLYGTQFNQTGEKPACLIPARPWLSTPVHQRLVQVLPADARPLLQNGLGPVGLGAFIKRLAHDTGVDELTARSRHRDLAARRHGASHEVPADPQHLFGARSAQDFRAVFPGHEINLIAPFRLRSRTSFTGRRTARELPHLETRIPISSRAGCTW